MEDVVKTEEVWEMDPISIIVAGLVAGASEAVKETAGTAVKEAYTGLKNLIKSRFADDPAAVTALEAHEKDPDTWEKPLRKSLAEVEPENDPELLDHAKSLLEVADPEGTVQGKYNLNITGNVQGLVQGDHNQTTMNFGSSDDSKE